jgi:hypothetical protein
MTTTAPGRRSPAQLDRELQALIDLQLGEPGHRVHADRQAEVDQFALQEIAYALRSPDWDRGLLEDVIQIIRATGRQVSGAPLEVLPD